jgi:hypothetical protein
VSRGGYAGRCSCLSPRWPDSSRFFDADASMCGRPEAALWRLADAQNDPIWTAADVTEVNLVAAPPGGLAAGGCRAPARREIARGCLRLLVRGQNFTLL